MHVLAHRRVLVLQQVHEDAQHQLAPESQRRARSGQVSPVVDQEEVGGRDTSRAVSFAPPRHARASAWSTSA
eukprot:767089-Hanusia_phi.AAC.5